MCRKLAKNIFLLYDYGYGGPGTKKSRGLFLTLGVYHAKLIPMKILYLRL